MKEKQNFLAVTAFVYFGFNYTDPKEFIRYICDKTNESYLYDHLMEKFNSLYDRHGSRAVMQCFFCELETDLREALVDYAIKVYYPVGMKPTDEEKKLLGI